ncbi:HAD family hydrolase [Azotosporobacter soli]|uniref:HAD family hydrolase n=1 Tax=Azotosporobacter soli TaxID=3055040 RepID=UPI0031FF12A4
METVFFPDGRKLDLRYAVVDYNGTLAVDGLIAPMVKELLLALSQELNVNVITADTFGQARPQLAELVGVKVAVIKPGAEGEQKAELVRKLGPEHTVCIGNGSNDAAMFALAALSIAVVGREGASMAALREADLVVSSPQDAIGLLLNPKRLLATLRI